MISFENKIFEKTSNEEFEKGEYFNCRFLEVDFSSYNFSGFKFIDCDFNECNLSLSNPNNAFFQNVHFQNCKILGVHFDYINSFGLELNFENCVVNHATFYQMKLKGISFQNCQLQKSAPQLFYCSVAFQTLMHFLKGFQNIHGLAQTYL